jgi:hypothetical protein
MEGKSKPCSDMGRVAILKLNIHRKLVVAWTLAVMSLSSLSASASVIGLESEKGSHSQCNRLHDDFPDEGDQGWTDEFHKSEGLNEFMEFMEAVG